MRRLFPVLPLLLMLALVACGGTKPQNAVETDQNSRILVAGSGTGAAAQPAGAASAPAPEDTPADAAQGLTVEEVRYTASGDGGLTVSGKVVNRGQGEASTTRIAVDLMDASGQRVARASFYNLQLPTLKPGANATWQGQTRFVVAEGQRLQLTVEGKTPGSK